MPRPDIVRQRLTAQRLDGASFACPADVVAFFGAVQAQDYRGVLWGVGQRVAGATEADIERALAERSIVRTWPMRGTLHFVAPDDVRWMLRLLAPRAIARAAGRHRQLGLDAATFAQSRDRLTAVLEGGNQLTRDAIYAELDRSGISTAGQRGIHILAQLAMEGVICFGARHGKQQTFALLDEWVPSSRMLEGDEALAELAARYFASHGPATLADFAWWSSLPVRDARRGLELARSRLVEVEGTYAGTRTIAKKKGTLAHLLPAYDEYTVAYRDRSAFLDEAHAPRAGNGIFSPVVLIEGRIAGTWKRTLARRSVVVRAAPFTQLDRAARRALELASERYAAFLGSNADLLVD